MAVGDSMATVGNFRFQWVESSRRFTVATSAAEKPRPAMA